MPARAACTEADLDAIRYEVARADVMANTAQQAFDLTNGQEVDAERAEHVGHLMAAASEAASAALLAVDDLRRVVGSRATVPSGVIWKTGEANGQAQDPPTGEAVEDLEDREAAGRLRPGYLIQRLYDDLVEVEALAITADECVTSLPPYPSGKYERTLARLYTLVAKTSSRACAVLERGEQLVAMHSAHLMAKRTAAGR